MLSWILSPWLLCSQWPLENHQLQQKTGFMGNIPLDADDGISCCFLKTI